MNAMDTNRLEAFSDGVFAVAITLLVLNIKVPGLDPLASELPNDASLWPKVRDEWPMLVAYATSFLTIGIMWLNHHRLFSHIKRVNDVLLIMNLALLAIIVFVPVPTALLAEYIVRPDQHAAAIIYSGVFFLLACCFNLLWRYASYNNRLLGRDVDTRSVAAISRQYLFGPVFYLVAFGLALISTPASVVFTFILALFFALPGSLFRSLSKKGIYTNVEDAPQKEPDI
jgi:uncharacterized membrane protein